MKPRSGPIVIAHRGASGYLPEHTLAAKTLAYAMGADFLEQDVVATRDDELIVMHDIHLDRTTNVAEIFPGRSRDDGRYYARDFDLAEIRRLRAYERVDEDGEAVYPERFPPRTGCFRVQTLRDELEYVARLNANAARPVGIYPEIKRPALHKAAGVDIAPIMLELLAEFGYDAADDPIFLQCFDPVEVVRIRQELGSELPLVQLIGDNSWQEADTDYDAMLTPEGLEQLATVVDGIGPWFPQLYTNTPDGPRSNGVAEAAAAVGLAVHPYTFRSDSLFDGFGDFDALVAFATLEVGVDGLFSDFPDLARAAADRAVAGET